MTTEALNNAMSLTTAAINDEREILRALLISTVENGEVAEALASMVAIARAILEAAAKTDPQGRSAVQIWQEVSMALAEQS